MLGRRKKTPVVGEVPAPNGASARLGALGRAELDAYAGLAGGLRAAHAVMTSGPAKSQVALGLAAAALSEGHRVALLECDLAEPTLAGTLGISPGPGLHEYLTGEAESSQILQPLVLAGPASGRAVEPLACIVAGEALAAPVALLDSDRCDQAIEKLRRAYDLLVIDGPPLEEDPDSLRALSEHSTATLVCGERNEIPKRLPIPVSGLVLLG
jgi:Mrp family chromosome partitioning ATPase